MKGRVKLGRGLVASVTAALCLGGVAAGAQAATLSVSVKPNPSHAGGRYAVTIKGSYKASQVSGKAFLLGVIQYSAQPCAATAKGEYQRTGGTFFVHSSPPHSPFKFTEGFTVGSPGVRRVCAYLYGRVVTPSDNATPIARASAKEVVKP
jgi:hypothetical protein